MFQRVVAMIGILAAPAAAQPLSESGMRGDAHGVPNCPADAEPVPPALAGWAAHVPMTAATDAASADRALVTVGKGVDLALAATPDVHYVVRPENPGGSVSHGGMVGFAVATAGTYRVALSSAAWIDVVRDGASMVSVGHGRGPACSGMRKMVDFALQPGRYVLQVAGNGTASIGVLVAQMP